MKTLNPKARVLEIQPVHEYASGVGLMFLDADVTCPTCCHRAMTTAHKVDLFTLQCSYCGELFQVGMLNGGPYWFSVRVNVLN